MLNKVYVCRYVCMYVGMYVCVYVCVYACVYVCVYACMYVYIQWLVRLCACTKLIVACEQVSCEVDDNFFFFRVR